MSEHCFKSTLFKVEPGEDEETNPNRCGKQLALWLKEQFIARGYEKTEVIPEDWGWCVIFSRNPYNSWVGCGNVDDDGAPVVWMCFAEVEVPLLKRTFNRGSPEETKASLDAELHEILSKNKDIELIECP